MVVFTLCLVLLGISIVCIVNLTGKCEQVNDVLEYLNNSDLMMLHKRLKEEFIGYPEQKKMLADVEERLRYHGLTVNVEI